MPQSNTISNGKSTINKPKFSVYDIAIVGVMAAIIFAITYFIKIPITLPSGDASMIKLANAFVLLAGMLFGGVKGGLAAGIGSFIFDLLDPRFVASAPFTLVFFFTMAFVCGSISYGFGHKGNSLKWNIIGALAGSFAYQILYLSKKIILLILSGSDAGAAFASIVPTFAVSAINIPIAVILATVLAPVIKTALKKAGLYKHIS
ncbi:MAG: ECF transporter S component [Oscillospiraceae bacterium]